MRTLKIWLVKAALFVGIIFVAAIMGSTLGIHLGDSGYGPLLIATMIVYYLSRNQALKALGLGTYTAWQPNVIVKGGTRLYKQVANGKVTYEARLSGITGSTEPAWASDRTGEITNDNGIQWVLVKIKN